MEEERISKALSRIAAAATRIEAAAGGRAPSPASTHAASSGDLARKHEALKREAWAALAELDSLIEAVEA